MGFKNVFISTVRDGRGWGHQFHTNIGNFTGQDFWPKVTILARLIPYFLHTLHTKRLFFLVFDIFTPHNSHKIYIIRKIGRLVGWLGGQSITIYKTKKLDNRCGLVHILS